MTKFHVETHFRSILKAVSWRLGGTIITVLVVWILLGKLDIAAKVGMLDTAVKIGVFYAHERMWEKIPFGKKKLPDYEI
jgi:adenylylsulfate kinase